MAVNKEKIPNYIYKTLEILEKADFKAYLVGGCVRDMVMGRIPKDWDITTNAKPEQIISLFKKAVYKNNFGTVTVLDFIEDVSRETFGVIKGKSNTEDVGVSHETDIFDNLSSKNLKNTKKIEKSVVSHETTDDIINFSRENQCEVTRETLFCESVDLIEITPFRKEGKYSDNRHPDTVVFSEKIEDDLKRRDFTVNAMAYDLKNDQIIDLFDGLGDIDRKIIKTVGNSDERLTEDALRILRAVRFSVQLGFEIDRNTEISLVKNAFLLKNISMERIRDEFIKIILNNNAVQGVLLLKKINILSFISPELDNAFGIKQNGDHIYDVGYHSIYSLGHAIKRDWSLEIRLAALFHDIGKPKTRFWSDEKKDYTFYGHDVVGKKITEKILENLKFPKKLIEKISKLVRYHMFFSDTEKITLSAVRRIIANVGKENIWDLMKVRACDRIGMGKPKESPYRLRKYQAMIDEAMRDPISVAMLKINGEKIMGISGEKPSPRIGFVLHALLEEVLDNPNLNTEEYLENRVLELIKFSEEELKKIGEAGKGKKKELEEEEIGKIRKKHGVK